MTASVRAPSACLWIAAGSMFSHMGALSPAGEPSMDNVESAVSEAGDVIFAVRRPGEDAPWYATFGYYCEGAERPEYTAGAKLCRLSVVTGDVTVLLDDPTGRIRDPFPVSRDNRRGHHAV